MTSIYEYIALADLENFTGLNYDGINATQFSDARVDATITLAERMVNAYLGVSSAQTKTDGIIICTMIIAAKMMNWKLNEYGYGSEDQEQIELIKLSMKSIFKMFLDNDQTISVDSIPMQGANNHIR